MYDMIASITQAHLAHCAYTQAKTQGLLRKPATFPILDSQQSAGVQKALVWQHFASLLSPSIAPVVEFAKRIPAFPELSQDAQLLCIKLGFFEVWLVHAARLSDRDALTFADGTCVSRHHLELMFDREFAGMVYNFVCWINSLHLSDCVIGLYAATVLVSAERGGPCDAKALQPLQERVLEALHQKLEEEGVPHLFPALVAHLRELHVLGCSHLEHLRWFRSNWMHLRLPPLFAELFDIPRHDIAHR